jgi:hypothetical protein
LQPASDASSFRRVLEIAMKSWKGRKNRKVVGKVVIKAARAKVRVRRQSLAAGLPVAQRPTTKVLRSSKSR